MGCKTTLYCFQFQYFHVKGYKIFTIYVKLINTIIYDSNKFIIGYSMINKIYREVRNRNSRARRNSIPEREIDTEDTENAQLQVD